MGRRRKQSLAADKSRNFTADEGAKKISDSNVSKRSADGQQNATTIEVHNEKTAVQETNVSVGEAETPIFQVICSDEANPGSQTLQEFQLVAAEPSHSTESSQILFISETRPEVYETRENENSSVRNESGDSQTDQACEVETLPLLSDMVKETTVESGGVEPMILSKLDGEPLECGSKVFVECDMMENLGGTIVLPPGCELFEIPGSLPSLLKATQSSIAFSNETNATKANSKGGKTIDFTVESNYGLSTLHVDRYMFSPNLCRICLLEKPGVVDIFEDVVVENGMIVNSRGPNAANRYKLIPAIKTLLDIDVSCDDELPHKICPQCLDFLMNFSVFRKRIAIGQSRLKTVLAQVKSSVPVLLPSLGEPDISKTDIYRHTSLIVDAKALLKSSEYSHLVSRQISDRVWDKIFCGLNAIVGFKSGKLQSLESYVTDAPFANGFFCELCQITVIGPASDYCQHHVDFHGVNGVEEVELPCDLCNLRFPLISPDKGDENYSEHWLQHFFFHECIVCSKRLPSVKGLWVHNRSAHGNHKRDYVCNICDKRFRRKQLLLVHRESHFLPGSETPKERSKDSWCHVCRKSVTGGLAAHMGSVHSEKRKYHCSICDKWFKRREILSSHKLSVHMSTGKEECEVCHQKFPSVSSKALHMLKHSTRKPYGCPLCPKRFYTQDAQMSHERKHKAPGGSTCPIPECGKIFKRKIYLTEHMLLHSGEKPNKCPECGKQIRMKSNFLKHMKLHEKKKKLQHS